MGQKEDGRGSNSACSDLFADSMEEALPLAGHLSCRSLPAAFRLRVVPVHRPNRPPAEAQRLDLAWIRIGMDSRPQASGLRVSTREVRGARDVLSFFKSSGLIGEQNRRKNGSYSKVELRCFKALWRSRHSRKCRQLRLFKESRDERKPICPF